MVGTIVPMVYGARKRSSRLAWIHLAGAILSASLFGTVLGGAGGLARQLTENRLGVLLVAVIALAYSAHELGLIRLPTPEFHRQVPAQWRWQYAPPLAALLYGLGLGVGVLTHITTTSLYVVLMLILVLANPGVGAVVLAAYGVGRGLPILIFSLISRDAVGAMEKHDRIVVRDPRFVHRANGTALALASLLLMSSYVWPL
jgi:cytochrome c biogenesis protein CcdA